MMSETNLYRVKAPFGLGRIPPKFKGITPRTSVGQLLLVGKPIWREKSNAFICHIIYHGALYWQFHRVIKETTCEAL